MKCKVLILTHGKLAGSLYDTVKFIYGSTDGLAYLNMPEPFDQSAYGKMIADIVSENKEQGTLILCDLFGGSPFLTSAKLLKENNSWSEMWLKFGQKRYNYDNNFKNISDYAMNNKIKSNSI